MFETHFFVLSVQAFRSMLHFVKLVRSVMKIQQAYRIVNYISIKTVALLFQIADVLDDPVLWTISLRCVTSFILWVNCSILQRCSAFYYVAFVYLHKAVLLCLTKFPDWSTKALNGQFLVRKEKSIWLLNKRINK